MNRRRRILVADDNPGILKALKLRLEASGFEVIQVQDSYQALEFCRKHDPDLLLLDVNMPAGSGFSVHDRIKRTPEYRHVPVIYLTGDDRESVDQKAGALGAAAVIRKPVAADELIRTIWSVLDAQPDDKPDTGLSAA